MITQDINEFNSEIDRLKNIYPTVIVVYSHSRKAYTCQTLGMNDTTLLEKRYDPNTDKCLGTIEQHYARIEVFGNELKRRKIVVEYLP